MTIILNEMGGADDEQRARLAGVVMQLGHALYEIYQIPRPTTALSSISLHPSSPTTPFPQGPSQTPERSPEPTNTLEVSRTRDHVSAASKRKSPANDQDGSEASSRKKRCSSTQSNGRNTSSSRKSSNQRKSSARRPLADSRIMHGPEDWDDVSDDLAINTQCSVSTLDNQRYDLFQKLLDAPAPQGSQIPPRDGMTPGKMYNSALAAQMVKFFFEDTMGPPGKQQLLDFVLQYRPASDEAKRLDLGAAARMRQLAMESSVPAELGLLFASLSVDANTKMPDKNSALAQAQKITRLRDILEHYDNAAKEIDENKETMWAYVGQKIGVENAADLRKGKQGVSKASIARKVICAVADIDASVLNTAIDRARPVDLFLKRMGDPFMLILPPSSIKFLKEMGKDRINAACDLVLDMCPWVANFVQCVETFIWKPYVDGVPRLPLDNALLAHSNRDAIFLNGLNKLVQDFRDERREAANLSIEN